MIRKTMPLLVAFALAAQPSHAALSQIGAAAAVAGLIRATSMDEAAPGHELSSGKPVFLNDLVKSDAKGRLQVLLLDETVFTMGPNAEMKLDEFVYDPRSNEGKVSARMLSGAFRFVTGKIAAKEPAQMKVKLPTGTIGIRGTIVGGMVGPTQSLVVLLGPGGKNTGAERPGEIRVESAGQAVTIATPGYGTTVEPGRPPSPPFLVPQAQLQAISQAVNPPPPAEQEKSESGGDPSAAPQPDEQTADSGSGEASQVEEESGSEVASAINALEESSPVATKSEDSSTVATTGNQASSREGGGISNSTWDGIRGAFAPPGSQGLYRVAGFNTQQYTCTGGSCSSGSSGDWHAQLVVNFGNRTVGGFSSGGAPSTIHLQTGPLGGAEAKLDSIGFSGLSGDAKLRVVMSPSQPGDIPINSSFSAGCFSCLSGTTITFKDKNGTVAAEAQVELKYFQSSTPTNITGSGTATMLPESTPLEGGL